MTAEQIASFVDVWKHRLKLDRHRIKIEFEAEGDDDQKTIAETKAHRAYDQATIRFYLDEMAKLAPRDAEATIIHELLHVAHKDVEKFFEAVELDTQIHRDVFSVVENSFYQLNEVFVDRMAYVLLEGFGSAGLEASLNKSARLVMTPAQERDLVDDRR